MLSSRDFTRQTSFSLLRRGEFFRFSELPPQLICMKAEGERGQDWVLLLGTQTGGRFPAPWYSAMDDVTGLPMLTAARAVTVHPLLPPRRPGDGLLVMPGDLLASADGAFHVFVEGRTSIDLQTGARKNISLRAAVVHKAWCLHFADEPWSEAFFYNPTPGSSPAA